MYSQENGLSTRSYLMTDITYGLGPAPAQQSVAAFILSPAFLLIVAIPIFMAIVAAMIRTKFQRCPYVAPTDLFGAIIIADLSVAIDPNLISPLTGSYPFNSVNITAVHAFAVLLGGLAWFHCILSVEPHLEGFAARWRGAVANMRRERFSFQWLFMYTAVMGLLGAHYYAYAHLTDWAKL